MLSDSGVLVAFVASGFFPLAARTFAGGRLLFEASEFDDRELDRIATAEAELRDSGVASARSAGLHRTLKDLGAIDRLGNFDAVEIVAVAIIAFEGNQRDIHRSGVNVLKISATGRVVGASTENVSRAFGR